MNLNFLKKIIDEEFDFMNLESVNSINHSFDIQNTDEFKNNLINYVKRNYHNKTLFTLDYEYVEDHVVGLDNTFDFKIEYIFKFPYQTEISNILLIFEGKDIDIDVQERKSTRQSYFDEPDFTSGDEISYSLLYTDIMLVTDNGIEIPLEFSNSEEKVNFVENFVLDIL